MAYEKRVGELERQKIGLTERQASDGRRQGTFEQVLELAPQFLANPALVWENGNLDVRKMVLRLTFAAHLE